jgi:hypothetical protein
MFFLQLALNPKVSYCVVIYSKHCRKNIRLDPFPTVVDPSDPNEFALNPKVSYCVVIYSKPVGNWKGSSIMFFLQCLLYITTQ